MRDYGYLISLLRLWAGVVVNDAMKDLKCSVHATTLVDKIIAQV